MTLFTRGVPRTVAAALTLAISFGGMLGASASARPPAKPGAPADLAVTVTKPAGPYRLASTWTAVRNATSYKVGVTSATGTSLASSTVSQTAWSGAVAATAGSTVHVTVTSFNGTRRGSSTTVSETMPDLTPPAGKYSTSWPATSTGSTVTVTLTADGVSDDVSTPAAIDVKVNWGDKSAVTETNGAAATITHDYAMTTVPTRYVPVVTLTDAAGNTTTAPVGAVVIADNTPPSATAALSQNSAWAAYTKVSLKQAATDNLSPESAITRSVHWGDGTVQTVKGDSQLSHVYRTAGTYAVTVTAADEAQPANTATAAAGTVTVKADTYRPGVQIVTPKTLRNAVRSWRVIKGTASDTGTGVRSVQVRVVERRGAAYYAFRPATGTWVRAKTLAAAFKLTVASVRVPVARQWQMTVRGLTLGELYIRAWSVDHVGNVSLMRSHQQALTRR